MSRYFAFAKESSYGTPNTTAEMYLNAGKCTLDAPKDPTIEVPSFEETPSDLIKGLYSPSGDVELALDIHSILPILYFTFGQYKFTAGESDDPNIHEIWAAGCHKLPSFTSMVGKGDCGNTDEEFEHQFYGCVISKLSFENLCVSLNDFGLTPQFSRTLVISEVLTEMNKDINDFIDKFN